MRVCEHLCLSRKRLPTGMHRLAPHSHCDCPRLCALPLMASHAMDLLEPSATARVPRNSLQRHPDDSRVALGANRRHLECMGLLSVARCRISAWSQVYTTYRRKIGNFLATNRWAPHGSVCKEITWTTLSLFKQCTLKYLKKL